MIWIWSEEEIPYAEFRKGFEWQGGAATLEISADHKYAAFVNGAFVSNGQYADLPVHKSVDTVDIAPYLHAGKNELIVRAYHMGEDFAVSRTMPAGVAFEIKEWGRVAARSDRDTLCRPLAGYLEGDTITPQIGCGWKYDFTAPPQPWGKCRVVENGFVEEPRPVEKLKISPPLPAETASQGIFSYRGGDTAAEKMQNAWLSSFRFADMTGEKRLNAAALASPVRFAAAGGDGVFVLVDLKKETCGHLSFSLTVDKPCRALLGWGEHLADLRVRAKIGSRNFASELTLAAGENDFEEYFWRIGCRYLCLFVEADAVTVKRLSVRETTYPFKIVEKHFGDRLIDRIYEIGRRTLQLCAHEHYEDCPWREQALYGMDSRNQMLFGYGAFEEYALPRASLRLFAYSAREDGLVQLCAPARARFTIPSFTAYWLIALAENAEADYEESFVAEMLPYAEKMLAAFEKRTTERGVSAFTEAEYWNFYEWSDGLDGGNFNRTESIEPSSDAILTALVYRGVSGVAALEKRLGRAAEGARLEAYAERLSGAFEAYYDTEKGLYASFIQSGERSGYHAYTQAAVLSTGKVPDGRKKRLCGVLKHPNGEVVEMTYAALQLKYDAIVEAENDVQFCVDEICDVFGKMAFTGATSYWETAAGEADFEDTGSLCHGWSAVACYVFDRYLGGREEK